MKYLILTAIGGVLLLIPRPFVVKNNNPGHIRYYESIQWVGQTGKDGKGFVIFDTPENGIRASAINLRSKINRGVDTIAKVVESWAPKVGSYDGKQETNPTDNYINFVSQRTGISPHKILNFDEDKRDVLKAIFHFEKGAPIDNDLLERGLRLV